jgi:SAM-dependent methyltransferase
MKVYTTEITSEDIASDNPIHQRLLRPYYFCKDYIHGDLLELGCGEGRGIDVIRPLLNSYLGIDKIGPVVDQLAMKYPDCQFIQMHFPSLKRLGETRFDSVISFQVIEHIKNDIEFLQDIHTVLRPGGIAMITTPNRRMSLSRNPWHIREYIADELSALCSSIFTKFTILGITGNDKVMRYYEENKKSVKRITRFDFLNIQYHLPAALLKIPYDIMNRINRNRLNKNYSGLVGQIMHDDYLISETAEKSLDLLCIMYKE